MNDKEKQIEEMAYSICGMPQAGYTNDITDCAKCFRRGGCIYQNFVRRFLEKGYRKQSDTAREILQKLIYNITVNNTNDGYLSESIDYSSTIDDIKELVAQYGVEVEE